MRARVALAGLLATLVVAGPATAHVDVLPARVNLGEAVQLTVRVPTERSLPTTIVEVRFPSHVTVYRFEQPPGWQVQPKRAADGRLRGVVYRGGRIGVDRYQDFHMLATPFDSGTAVWEVLQTYADGQVKPWTGPPEEEEEDDGSGPIETGPTAQGPAARMEIVAGGAGGAEDLQVISVDGDDGSGVGIWLGVIAIAIAAAAGVGVGLLWSTRPARLPEDGPEDG